MARLIFRSADGQERTYELAGELKMGAGSGNDVVLADPAIGERHCRFFADDQGKVWVELLSGPGGTSEVVAGAELAFGGWVARLERPLVLEVRSDGALRGQTFPLSKDRLVVGSGPTSDLHLAHDSVSARHAQIAKIGGRLNLLDLGSADGTFVNGERVSSAAITETDLLRFGAIELGFQGVAPQPAAARPVQAPEPEPEPAPTPPVAVERPASAPPSAKRSRALLLLAAGGAALAGGLFYVESIPEPAPPDPFVADSPVRRFDPDRHVRDCRAVCGMRSPAFDARSCVRGCQDLLDADPAFEGFAPNLRDDLLAPGYLAKAADLVSAGKPEEALPVLLRVRPGSESFLAARDLYERAAAAAADEKKKDCRTVVAGGLYEQALGGPCLRVLELTCGLRDGPDPGALVRFHHAARSLGRERPTWTCPPTPFTLPFDASEAGDGGQAGQVLIRDKYPHPRLAEIMVGYYETGDADEALDALKRLEADLAPLERASAKEAASYLDVIRQRMIGLRSSRSLMFLEQIRQAEARILPLGLHSPFVRAASKLEAPVPPAKTAIEEKICADVKAAYERSRPGSKQRKQAQLRAVQAGCPLTAPKADTR